MWWFWALLVDKPFSFLSPLGTSPHPASRRSIRQHALVLTSHVQNKNVKHESHESPMKTTVELEMIKWLQIGPQIAKRNTQEINLIGWFTARRSDAWDKKKIWSRNQLLISIMTYDRNLSEVALYGARFESLMSNLRTLMKDSMNMLAILCWQ